MIKTLLGLVFNRWVLIAVLLVAAGFGFVPTWWPSAPGQPGTAADPEVVNPTTMAARTASTSEVPAVAAISTRRRRRPDRSTKTGSMITCSCRGDSGWWRAEWGAKASDAASRRRPV